MSHKPFSAETYAEDDPAKGLVIKWLKKHKIVSAVNEDKYGIDLITSTGTGVEVEVKHNWKGPAFPYECVHFSARKSKFAKPNTYFVMLNDELTHALVTTGESLFVSPIVSKRTKYTRWEQFIEVPIELCTIYKLSVRNESIPIS